MVTVKYPKNCDLCALPVEIDGFSLGTGEDVKVFCCAGCQSIYQLIYANKPKQDNNHQSNNDEDN